MAKAVDSEGEFFPSVIDSVISDRIFNYPGNFSRFSIDIVTQSNEILNFFNRADDRRTRNLLIRKYFPFEPSSNVPQFSKFTSRS